ncbi:Fur family transcriptional regulator [Thermincola ferriacetica]
MNCTLRAKTTRMTKQKRIILEILRNTDCHPSADWVYEQAKKVIPDISLGTVYRNLNVLKELGEILELNYGSTYSRYDGKANNHYHFVCENCNKLVDVDMPVYQGLDKMVQDTTGYQVKYHRMEFYGICDECLQKMAAEQR